MSDNEQDWIAKYRAALDSEQGRRSAASTVIAAIRRFWRSLGLGLLSRATDSSPQPIETEIPAVKKIAQREVSPAQEERDTKAS